jgi:hypothetical protein
MNRPASIKRRVKRLFRNPDFQTGCAGIFFGSILLMLSGCYGTVGTGYGYYDEPGYYGGPGYYDYGPGYFEDYGPDVTIFGDYDHDHHEHHDQHWDHDAERRGAESRGFYHGGRGGGGDGGGAREHGHFSGGRAGRPAGGHEGDAGGDHDRR